MPNTPVFPGMFAGRLKEIEGIDQVLFQAKNDNPTHILLIGERGIGKSSLLLFADSFAKGDVKIDSTEHKFLTIKINLTEDILLVDLILKIKDAIERELASSAKALASLKGIWEVAKKFEISTPIVRTNFKASERNVDNLTLDKLTQSIVNTVKLLTTNNAVSELGLVSKRDGIVILIDEADKARSDLNLGSFLKNLTEELITENCNKVVFIIAGLPNLRDVLRESHESSLRLFEEFEIVPLSKTEVEKVVSLGLKLSNDKHSDLEPIQIDPDSVDTIYTLSEGYPHFVQQTAYSAFTKNIDNLITVKDVEDGYFLEQGALDLIGDRYYKHTYNSCSQPGKEILQIMANKWNEWVTRDEIKNKFVGPMTSLDNGLRSLKEHGVILKKEGSRGSYRLQWSSFAFWIKYAKFK